MKLSDLQLLVQKGKPYIDDRSIIYNTDENINLNDIQSKWRWGHFTETLLVKYYLEKKQNLYVSPHEGLVLTYAGCKKIVEFLENHPDIKDDLFQFNDCGEEFAFQTICMDNGENFYYVGNGCCTNDPIGTNNPDLDIIKFMYKVNRDTFTNTHTFMRCSAN